MANSSSQARFSWQDPLLLDAQLTDDERMVRIFRGLPCNQCPHCVYL